MKYIKYIKKIVDNCIIEIIFLFKLNYKSKYKNKYKKYMIEDKSVTT